MRRTFSVGLGDLKKNMAEIGRFVITSPRHLGGERKKRQLAGGALTVTRSKEHLDKSEPRKNSTELLRSSGSGVGEREGRSPIQKTKLAKRTKPDWGGKKTFRIRRGREAT